MAVLSKIRDRSGFLIIAIGLAMFAFVISPKDIIDFVSNKSTDLIGEVNGEEMTFKDFMSRVEAHKNQNPQENAGALQVENMIWSQMIREKIYESKLEQAGVIVGEQAIWQAIIGSQEVQQAPMFKDKSGVFNENLVKEYVAKIYADNQTPQGKSRLDAWKEYEKSVKRQLSIQTYEELIKVGFNVGPKEALNNAKINNTTVTSSYVFVPYATIADNKVKVTDDEIEDYVKEHKNQFKTEASRKLKFVNFSLKPSKADEKEVLTQITALLNNRQEYNTNTKKTELVVGFKNATDPVKFIQENGSDLPINNGFQTANQLGPNVLNVIKNAAVGSVVGPYRVNDHYHISKVLAVKQMPDSVKASHILISYVGAQNTTPNVKRTDAQAKKIADSLASVIKSVPTKMAVLAAKYSNDPGSATKGGDLNWFTYDAMVPEFRDYTFENSVGSVGVVKTAFGYHVIKVDDQKRFNNAYQLASLARKVEASEATENSVYAKAESFAAALMGGASIDKLALKSAQIVGEATVTGADAIVGSLGENRQIVKWAFDGEVDEKEVKRFDLDNLGYAIVQVQKNIEKGLMPASEARPMVEPILMRKKKAELIAQAMENKTLKQIAAKYKTKVTSFNGVALGSPIVPSVGNEPAVVGAASALKPGKKVTGIEGNAGVFAIQTIRVVKGKVNPKSIDANREDLNLKNIVQGRIYAGLLNAAEINDFRISKF